MSETLDLEIEVAEVLELRELLHRWLANPDWQETQLVDWLEGKGLPPLDLDDEPYETLLQGLPLADERYWAETELAMRTARLLERQLGVDRSDDDRSDDDRNKLLFNLLMLSAGLGSPTQLAEPLYAIFQGRKFEGTWQGFDLRQALESALVANQRDNRLEAVWQEMLKWRRHDVLTGDEYAGFEGIRLMPESDASRGEPALDAIGAALSSMAAHLETRRDRRVVFHQLVNRIVRSYPGRPGWDSDLIYQAHKNHWPDWAVASVPRMFILLPSEEGRTALLWEALVLILESSGTDFKVQEWFCPDGQMCPGVVAKVSLSEEAFCFLNAIAPKAEEYRLTLELHHYRGVTGAVIDALSVIELELRQVKGLYGLCRPDTIKSARENLRIGIGVMSAGVR